MKKLLISILFLVTFVSMIHLSGLSRFSQMFDHANATRVSQERLPIVDTHVHYKEPAWEVYPPDVIILVNFENWEKQPYAVFDTITVSGD
jgi:hypothetical protein